MARKGRDLEKLIALLEAHLGSEGIQVTSPDYIRGRESKSLREVDISLRGQAGFSDILIIVECRDRVGDEDVTWIEQLASKRRDVTASKAVAVSSRGFTSGARNLATANDIELRTLDEVDPDEILLWFGFKEITAFKRSGHFIHISVQVSVPDGITVNLDSRVIIINALKSSFDINAPVFQRKRDGTAASFMDVWEGVSCEGLYSDVVPGAPREKRRIRVVFPNDQDRFQLTTTSGAIDITYIDVYAEVWIEVEKRPLTTVRVYRDGKRVLAQSAEFTFEHLGRELTFGLHQSPVSEKQVVSIRSEDAAEVNVNLVLVSLNDVIREYLEEVARAAETTTYAEIVSILEKSCLEREPDYGLIDKILGAISKKEHKEGRPLLSAVVVLPDGECPGSEFFALAQELGIYDGTDDLVFFAQELQHVHEYWRGTEAKDTV